MTTIYSQPPGVTVHLARGAPWTEGVRNVHLSQSSATPRTEDVSRTPRAATVASFPTRARVPHFCGVHPRSCFTVEIPNTSSVIHARETTLKLTLVHDSLGRLEGRGALPSALR